MRRTVAELQQMLSNYPPHMPVLLSSDAEGNSIRDFDGVSLERMYFERYEAYLVEDDDDGVEVIVLWPM